MVVLTCSRYRSVNSRINIFIVNLAAGDLAVCCFTMCSEVRLAAWRSGQRRSSLERS